MIPSHSKDCRECGRTLPIDRFYVHPRMRDGHLNKCCDCVKTRVKKHRRENDKVREYDNARAKDPERRAKQAEQGRRWRQENPEAYAAHGQVARALRSGRLKKEPCLFCSSEKHVHAHHADYSRPLDVAWLCAKCHNRLHALGVAH